MQTEERIVIPDEFAIEGARVGLAKLARLAALPGALDAVFSRTGVHNYGARTSSPYAPPPPGAPVAPQPAALPGAAPPGAPNGMSPADYAAAVARFQRFEQFLQITGALPPQS